MDLTSDERRELERLRQVEANYRVTLQALAVVTERLLNKTQGNAVIIPFDALFDSPDLIARRDEVAARLAITVSR